MTKKTVSEEHPLTARIIHWIFMISMGLLIFSGFYIHSPFFPEGMGWMRFVHFISMYVILLNLVVRIYWAFMGKPKDWRDFAFQKVNRGKFIPTIKYYLFLKKEHPIAGKYNPLQKMTYLSWIPLLIFQALTGFALYNGSIFGLIDAQKTMKWFVYICGGLTNVRILHFLVMWLFIITIAIHVYLVLVEKFKTVLYMHFGIRPEEK